MKYEIPKDKHYIAEGNVIVSLEEYNKLNKAMEVLKNDQNTLSKEQCKLNSAISNKMFLHTHTHDSFLALRYTIYTTYSLSKDAEEVLKPVLKERIKDEMRRVYKEFSNMSWSEFIQWRNYEHKNNR